MNPTGALGHSAATAGSGTGTSSGRRQRSGRKLDAATAPFVARWMAKESSAEMTGARVHSAETCCCERPIFSASAVCEPTIRTASATKARNPGAAISSMTGVSTSKFVVLQL